MKTEKIEIDTEFIRLDSLLKFSGAVDTGGRAKFVIQNGSVLVNGQSCKERGKKIRPGDTAQFESICYEVCQAENTSSGT